jgi:HAD superfamily hydrolase (TIGR01490 family)
MNKHTKLPLCSTKQRFPHYIRLAQTRNPELGIGFGIECTCRCRYPSAPLIDNYSIQAPDFIDVRIPTVALAIFDLDNTLLAGDSDYSWGVFLVEKKLVDAETYRIANEQFYQDYKNGTLDIRAYLQFSLAPLTRFTQAELSEMHAEFMQKHIEPLMLDKAQALLNKHREQGDYLLIITATNGFITRPIAKRLGVDDILATDPEVIDGRHTGNFVGTPCFQAGKITNLHQWLQTTKHSLEGAYFYSDSINDLPLLELVDTPVAVDPDERLAAIAAERNWQIISLRD